MGRLGLIACPGIGVKSFKHVWGLGSKTVWGVFPKTRNEQEKGLGFRVEQFFGGRLGFKENLGPGL